MKLRALLMLVLILAGVGPLGANRPVTSAQESIPAEGAGYIVVLDDSIVSAQDASTSIEAQYDLEIAPEDVYRHALNGFAAPLTDDQVAELREDPRVLSIEPDRTVYAAAQTLPTGVDRIDADVNSVARIGEGAAVDIDVAVIDSGVGPHEDITVAGGVDCTDTGSYADNGIAGHGTHVAGVLAAKDNSIGVVGVAPGARVWAVKVLEADGTGSVSDLLCGLDWVTANAATIEVANLSLGLYDSVGANCAASALRTAVCNAVAAGVTLVAAAGNDGLEMSRYVPAAYPEAIAVAALVDTDGRPGGEGDSVSSGCDDCFAAYSNYGSAVDLVAPGSAIRSTLPGDSYGSKSGTSMASPHVAGAAALYLVEHPGASAATVMSALQAASDLVSIPDNPAGVAQYVLDVGDGWAGPFTTPTPTRTPTITPTPSPTRTPTATPTGPPSISLSKEKSKYNGWVDATLSGFAANATVSVEWEDGTLLVQATTNAAGAAVASFRTPLVAYGTYDVTAFDGAGHSATTQLSVIPRILLNETSGPVDTVLRVYFYGFSPGEQVEVRWSDESESSYEVLATVTIASNGRGTSLIDIPAETVPGDYVVRGKVIGVSRSASTGFEVTGGASSLPTATVTPIPAVMTLSKEKSKYNGWVDATLSGFAPGGSVTLEWEDGAELVSVVADGSGGGVASFRTPLVAYGTYDVIATDSAGHRAEAQLSVIPRILLNETSGTLDTVLRVYFYGFSPGEQVEVRWSDEAEIDYEVLATITIASNGRGTSLIDAPAGSEPGVYVIRGKVLGVSRSASTTFTLTGPGSAAAESAEGESDESVEPRGFPTPTPTLTAGPEPTLPAATEAPTIEPTVAAISTATPTPSPTPTFEPTPTPTPQAAATEESAD